MMFDLTQDDRLYEALLARDAAYEGRAYVGVRSTGIYCRLTCPARKPKRENCAFYGSPSDCETAGFRACLRCKPKASEAEGDLLVRRVKALLSGAPDVKWSEAELTARGLDPSTVRRAFQRHFGVSFLEHVRMLRLKDSAKTLALGGKVIEAQIDAGFESASAFRAAFARLMGVAPGELASNPLLMADWIDTDLGPMIAVSDRQGLHLLEFADRKALPTELRKLASRAKGALGFGRPEATDQMAGELAAFFGGRSARFETPLVLAGSAFTRSVWAALRQIPPGETVSYGALARALGRPEAVRAVAQANGQNQIALAIPCHRVIGADGALTGYGGGLWRKQRLIALELGYRNSTKAP